MLLTAGGNSNPIMAATGSQAGTAYLAPVTGTATGRRPGNLTGHPAERASGACGDR